MILVLLVACLSTPDDVGQTRLGPRDSGDSSDSSDSGDSAGSDGGTLTTTLCPTDMVVVDGSFCIDRAEAALEELVDGSWVQASPYDTVDDRQVRAVVAYGSVPQGYISGDQADAACRSSGKRLCTSDEWLLACQGPKGWTWPYADSYVDWACNDHYAGEHPVTDYFGTSEGVWDSEHMNDPGINQQPGTVAMGGQFTACVSTWGAADLHGNLHEWVDDADGSFRGGFYADGDTNGPGCTYLTTAHDRSYHDYSTGFRCCADLP